MLQIDQLDKCLLTRLLKAERIVLPPVCLRYGPDEEYAESHDAVVAFAWNAQMVLGAIDSGPAPRPSRKRKVASGNRGAA